MRVFITIIFLIIPTHLLAANSFIMNRNTPTCDKYWDTKNKPQKMSEYEFDYRRERVCDQRWGLDGWPPVWLGSEPPHSKKIIPQCRALKIQYSETMAGRHLLDNYECEKGDGIELIGCKGYKPKPPPRAEEAAQILEKATNLNCFFY